MLAELFMCIVLTCINSVIFWVQSLFCNMIRAGFRTGQAGQLVAQGPPQPGGLHIGLVTFFFFGILG